jgi:hypothetical protein
VRVNGYGRELSPQPTPKHLRVPYFKSELLPFHSPLLRQSLLVSFPPLIDTLEFSEGPYLIRGQSCGVRLDEGHCMCA